MNMTAALIEKCNRQLHEDLDEVVAALEFATSAFKTYASSGDILQWIGSQADLRTVVLEFRTSTRLTDLNFIFQSLYVQAWSAFELFVRSLVTSYLEEVCSRAADFKSLNKAKLIERNLYHTGVALQQILENRSGLNIDFFAVAQNVATSIPASAKVTLNFPTFLIFMKGPSVEGIEDALKRIGFKNFDWDRVGGATAVQTAFGTKGTRETTDEVINYLKKAQKTRNNIVHRGENIEVITESDVRQGATVFEVVGVAIAEFLKTSLSQAASA